MVILVLAVVASLFGALGTQAAGAATTGSISGTIRGSAGALGTSYVSVYQGTQQFYAASANADANGKFTVGNLDPGTYVVQASATGVEGSTGYLTRYVGSDPTSFAATYSAAKRITVTADGTTTGADVTLPAAAAVSGTVTDTDGHPLSGMYVRAGSTAPPGNSMYGQTDANGHYKVLGVETGTVEVQIGDNVQKYVTEYYDDSRTQAGATRVSTTSGATTTHIDAALTPASSVSGTVTGADGSKVSNVRVSVDGDDNAYAGSLPTDSNGAYHVTGLRSGQFVLRFTPPNGSPYRVTTKTVQVGAHEDVTGQDQVLAEGGKITGVVKDGAGNAISGIGVYVSETKSPYSSAFATTAADGSYTVSGLNSSTYRVQFSDPNGTWSSQYFDGKGDSSTATPVSVSVGSTTSSVNAVLVKAASVSGTVTDGTSTPPSGVYVVLLDRSGASVGTGITDDAGKWAVRGVAPGSYKVQFAPPYYGSASGVYVTRFWKDSRTAGGGQAVVLAAGDARTGIDQQLARGATIKGHITSPAGGSVYLSLYDTDGGFVAGTTPDAQGDYAFGGLDAGKYLVGATRQGSTYQQRYYPDAASLEGATPVTVAAGGTVTGADIAFKTPGSISGRLLGPGGTPVANADVDVSVAGGYFFGGTSTTTDADGRYTASGLTAGQYVVRFTPSSDDDAGLAPAFNGGVAFRSEAPVLRVKDETTTTADGTLVPGGEFRGTVTDAAGAPVEGARVAASSVNGNDSVSANAYTDAQGHYRVRGLRPDSYAVTFSADGQVTRRRGIPVSITGTDPVTGIDARFAVGGRISGRIVRDVDGRPAEDAPVYVYGEDDDDSRLAYTDDTGHYEIAGVPAGTYRVVVGDEDSDFVRTYASSGGDGGSTSAADARDVQVVGTGTATVDVTARLAATISGTVQLSDGAGAYVDGTVEAFGATGDRVLASAQTNGDGTYVLRGLKSGSYRLRFSAFGYIDTYSGGAPKLDDAALVQTSASSPAIGQNATLSPFIGSGGPAGNNVIAGRITDNTGAPVAGQFVFASVDGSSVSLAVPTDADGVYRFTGLVDGSYAVGVGNPNTKYLTRYYRDSATVTGADRVSVAAGATKTGIDVVLPLAASIGGRLTGTDGEALSAYVTAYSATGGYVGSASTDPDGYYRVNSLPSGSYRLAFTPSDGSNRTQYYRGKTSLQDATPIAVTVGQRLSGIDDQLSTGGTITGVVKDASGAPVHRALVTAYLPGEEDTETTGFSDADGRFRITGLAAGSYRLEYDAPGNRPELAGTFSGGSPTLADATAYDVATGATVTAPDVTLRTGVAVSGTVTGGSSGVEGVRVSAYTEDDRYGGETQTGADGRYVLPGLAKGRYRISFYDPSGKYVSQAYGAGTDGVGRVLVADSDPISGIDATLSPAGRIAGTVLDTAGDVLRPDGGSYEHGQVDAQSTTNDDSAYADVDANGHYVLRGLSPGSYTVTFREYGYVGQVFDHQPLGATGTPVTVTAGDTHRGIDARLTTGGTISGQVTGPNGAPVSFAQVDAFDAAGNDVASTSTYTDGTYTLTGVPAGAIRVRFSSGDDPDAYVTEYWNDKPTLDAATPIQVATDQTVPKIDAQLASAAPVAPGTITGSVTGAAGGLRDASVTLYDADRGYADDATTDANGAYTFSDVRPGTYYVGATATGYGHRYHDAKTALSDATAIQVTSSTTTTIKALALPVAPAVLSGRVLSAPNTGIDGATVAILSAGGAETATPVKTATTGASGAWSVEVPAGTYKVRYTATGRVTQFHAAKPTFAAATTVTVAAGDTQPLADATLAATPGAISGTVRQSAGGPAIAGATVTAYDGTGQPVAGGTATTASDGTYTLAGLAPGGYKVGFGAAGRESRFYPDATTLAAATSVTVTTGATKSGVDAVLPVPPPTKGSIHGTVSGSDVATLGGATVKLYAGTTLSATAQTASNGTYSFDGLEPATAYHVEFAATGYDGEFYADKATLATATDVAVTAGSTTTASAQLAAKVGTVTGTVTSAGALLGSTTVSVYDATGAVVKTTTTSGNGTFSASVPAGDYRIGYSKTAYADRFWKDKDTLATATVVTVGRGVTVDGLDEALTPKPGAIAGRITDAGGTALTGATVSAYATDGSVARTGTTGTDGTYSLSVAPGNYRLGATKTGYVDGYSGGSPTLAGATAFAVTSNATTPGHDVALTAVVVPPPGGGGTGGGGTGGGSTGGGATGGGSTGGGSTGGGSTGGGATGGGSTGGGSTGGGSTGGGSTGGTATPPAGTLKLPSSVSVAPNGSFVVPVTCPKGTKCEGTVSVTVPTVAPRAKGKKAAVVVIAKGTLKAGSREVTLKLTARGKKLLKAGRGSLKVTVTLTAKGATKPISTKSARLKQAKKAKKG